MSDSILLIIKYWLKKRNVINEDQSIKSFFNNGLSFPILISKFLNFGPIPNINQKPTSEIDCENNNKCAFLFLLKYNVKIKNQNPKFETLQDRIDLLNLIFATQIFNESSDTVIAKLNLRFEQFNIHITNENDLINIKNISLLLNIFTDGSFPKTEFFEDIIYYCSSTEIPLIINKFSLEKRDLTIFLIQIQIFFEFFSDCDQQILNTIKDQIEQKESISKAEREVFQIPRHSKGKIPNENDDEDNHNEAFEFWYHSPGIYSYFNGILVFKSLRPNLYDIKLGSKQLNEQNFLYQIFKYDEKQFHWCFIEQSFEKMFVQGQDPMIQLVLIMNSNLVDMFNFLVKFNSEINNFNLGEQISVFSFRQGLKEAKIFLFVHVPKTKINHKNIRSILYQIYTFLYLISDFSIMMIDNDLYIPQIQFVSNVIKISEMYSKKIKLILNNSQLYFSIPTNDDKQKNKTNESQIKQKIKENIPKNYKICSLDKIKQNLDQSNLENSYRLSNIKELFHLFQKKFLELSELYLFIFTDIKNKDQPDFIRSVINTRFDHLFSDEKYKKIKGSVIKDFKKESTKFYPKCDINFSSIFEKELLRKTIDADQLDIEMIIDELDKKSEENLKIIFQKIRAKFVFDIYMIDKFKRGHQSFVRKTFFEIINSKCKEKTNLVYEELSGILRSQIEKDNEQFDKSLEEIKESKGNKNTNEKFEDANRKTGNYVVKETETTREIEINIDSSESLETIIPQDF